MAENLIDKPIVIIRHTKLGIIADSDEIGGYFIIPQDNECLAARGKTSSWKRTMMKGILAATAAFHIGKQAYTNVPQATIPTPVPAAAPSEAHLANGVTAYGIPEARNDYQAVVGDFLPLWTDTGQMVRIPEEDQMEIPLVDGWEKIYKPGQARVYASGARDRELIDETFNKLQEQGRLEWTKQRTEFSFPCFVVWKNAPPGVKPKGRVVVDVRALNKITIPDAYPIPVQTDILADLAGCGYISTVDCASFFYQFGVKKPHRYRLTVASHRGQETFNCALMGYRNSPSHAQRCIDRILRGHRGYARAYIDDIVIFSKTHEEHLKHLRAVFTELTDFNVCLSPKKSFLGYLLV